MLYPRYFDIDRSVQDCSISIANTLELQESCNIPCIHSGSTHLLRANKMRRVLCLPVFELQVKYHGRLSKIKEYSAQGASLIGFIVMR